MRHGSLRERWTWEELVITNKRMRTGSRLQTISVLSTMSTTDHTCKDMYAPRSSYRCTGLS